MATSTAAVYIPFLDNQLIGPQIDFDNDTIKVMLVESGYTFNPAHEFRSSVTNESSGTNYVAGGLTLNNVITTTISNYVVVNADNSQWNGTGAGSFSFQYAIVYQDTGNAATDLLISYHDFGSTQNNSAKDIVLQWSISSVIAYNTVQVAQTLGGLQDVSSATPTNGNILVADGTNWASQPQSVLSLTESQISDLQNYLVNVVEDTTPQLGGSLDVNGNVIISTAAGNIALTPDSTGNVILGTLEFDADQVVGAPVDQYVLTYNNGTGLISLQVNAAGTLSEVVQDITPQLGGDLDVNGNNIVSVSNADINIIPNGIGNVVLGTMPFDADQVIGVGQDNFVLTYDNTSGTIRLEATASTVTELSDLTDVNTSTPTNRFVLVADGVDFESRLLVEADISDLQAYLTTEVNNLTGTVTWANVPNANITQGSVTQHQAAIDHDALLNFVAAEHVDWAAAAAGTIHATNYVDNDTTDHTALSNIGTNTHAQIDTHIADATVHFTEGSIDHTAITNIGTNTHAQIDTHIADATVHFIEGSIDHTAITNIGTNSHAQIDTHISNTGIHFADATADSQNYVRNNNAWAVAPTYAFGEYVSAWDASVGTFPVATNQGDWFNVSVAGTVGGEPFAIGDTLIALINSPSTTIYAANWTKVPHIGIDDHTLLSNIGTNTHAQIDTHIANAPIHVDWAASGAGTIHATNYVDNDTTDHTALSNIGTNTHAQIDTHIADGTVHFTEGSIDHTAITNIGTNTHAQIDTHIADATVHFTQGAISITESQISDLTHGIFNVVEDTTPQLGGNLDVNGNQIVSTANGNININPNGTGNVLLGNYTLDGDQTVGVGQDNYILTYNNSNGLISLEAGAITGLQNIVEDLTPQLGANLDANGFNINSTSALRSISDNSVRMTMSGADPRYVNVSTTGTEIAGDVWLKSRNGPGGNAPAFTIYSDEVPSTNITTRVGANIVINSLSEDVAACSWSKNAGTTPVLYGFTGWTNPAGSDALLNVYNKDGDYISLSHNGTDGLIVTDVGGISLQPFGTNNVILGNFEFDADQTVGAGQDNYVLKYDNGDGEISLEPLGVELIASGTASAVAALNFTDLSANYTSYKLVISNTSTANDNVSLRMQVSTNNGSSYITTSDYRWVLRYARIRASGVASGGNAEGAWSDTGMVLMSGMGNAANEKAGSEIIIYNPLSTADYTRITSVSSYLTELPEQRQCSVAGSYVATTAVNAFRIIPTAGNIATITYNLYGYR